MTANKEKLALLKNSQVGKRAWIVGNGPSLRRAPLRLLHEMGEHSFAVNRIAQIYDETIWRPTFYSCALQDITGYGDKLDFVIDILQAIRLAPVAFVGEWLQHQVGKPDNVLWIKEFEPYRTERHPGCHPYYSKDITSGVNIGRSLVVPIQIADYMGYDQIILLGVDGHYSSAHVNNHMTEDYVAMSDLNYDWDVDRENDLQRQMHAIVRSSNPKVINGTDGGVVENYRRVNPFEILGQKATKRLW